MKTSTFSCAVILLRKKRKEGENDMEETLKMLNKLITTDLQQREENDLIRDYQFSMNPSILAVLFRKYYNQMFTAASGFSGINSDDMASLCLERLDACLLDFNFTTKFGTIFTTYLRNEFRRFTQEQNCQKRKANHEASSFDKMKDESNFDIESGEANSLDSIIYKERQFELMIYLESLNLSETELKFCDLILDNFDSNKEIAQKLKVSCQTLNNIREKLNNLIKVPDMLGFLNA